MRVGVFWGNYEPSAGGGYTFQTSLIESIRTAQSHHSFFLFHNGQMEHDPNVSVPLINVREGLGEHRRGSVYSVLQEIRRRIRPRWIANVATGVVHLIRKALVYVRTGSTVFEQASLLELAAKDYHIDVMWFPTPAYEKVTVPFIYTVWDLQHRVQPFFPEVSVTGRDWDSREKAYSSILPRATKVLTGTTVGKNEIIHFYGIYPDNVEVIPLPAPTFTCGDKMGGRDYIFKKYNLSRDYLLYPAQFWPHKNHINMLLALEILKKEYSIQLDMVFVGSDMGNEPHIRKTADTLGMSNYVHFLGFVPREDLFHLYRNAFALLFASLFGPDNLPPLEAFALECPVIASRVAGAEEQLGDAALLFDPKSPEEMAAAVKNLYQDPALRQTLVRKGLDRVRVRSPQDYVNNVSRILDEFEPVKRCWNNNYKHS